MKILSFSSRYLVFYKIKNNNIIWHKVFRLYSNKKVAQSLTFTWKSVYILYIISNLLPHYFLTKMKIWRIWLWILAISMVYLTACSNWVVKEWSKVSFTYEVEDPMTSQIIASWEKTDILMDYTGTALFQLVEGLKKWEYRADVLIDPFNDHDPELVYKQTALVLKEMWIPVQIGSVVPLSEKEAIVTEVLSEAGVDQVVLDTNPIETINPFVWTITVTSVK